MGAPLSLRMELIDPLWAEILRLVEESWQQGDARQDMDPRVECRSLFTSVVLPRFTPTRQMEKVHLHAPRNELYKTACDLASKIFNTWYIAAMADPCYKAGRR